MDTHKRGIGVVGLNANGAVKKSKSEMDSLSSGIGSKTKPCTKFFSKAGCPFGENCHFLHYFPGGYAAVAQLMNLAPPPPPTRTPSGLQTIQNGSSPVALKTKLCNRYGTPEGCKFNDKCNFAHGEAELGRPINPQAHDESRPPVSIPIPSRFMTQPDPPTQAPAASFGALATAKVSVDASLAGAIIGKGGANSKQICRQTGAKLSIRDHDTNPGLKNIELEGSFEQIKEASAMVQELISSVKSGANGPGKGGGGGPRSNYKTKLCENFAKGLCTFGDKCHFAHGASELRKMGM